LTLRTSIGGIAGAIFLALAVPASLLAAEPSATEGRKPLRILPLGDSITRGSYLALENGKAVGMPHPDGGGWRKGLQDRLRNAGIPFDFVGELDYLAYGRDGKVDPGFDPHHHGLAGFGNTRILSGGTVPTPADVLAARGVTEITVRPIVEVLAREKPDVILLMSGANGFDAAARDRLICTIGEASGAHLFVATIPPQKPPRAGSEGVEAYNASLPAVVAAQQAAGKPITLVDMHAALTPDDLLPDGVHPNRAGMEKIAATWFAALAPLRAAEPLVKKPLLEKIDVFQAKTGGYMLYRIPGIVVTAKGTVLAYCEARKSASGDWGTIDILLRRSTDGGRTWGEPHRLADVPGPKQKNPAALKQKLATNDEVTYNNCTLVADRVGPVHALFCLEYARCFYLRSDDDGLTWSKPVEITKTFEAFRSEFDWKVLATGPAHGIQLRSGRLVVPVWLSTGTGGHAHRPSVSATIYSDDSGATWHRGDIAVPTTPEWIDPNETVVVELADGRVMLNVRSWPKQHRRIVTTSPDGATGWTTPKFDDALLEPICMASIVRYSLAGEAGGRNRILFANPHWLERADGKAQPGLVRDRKNVSVKLSYDEGQTWPVNKSLEAGFSGYSDLAVLPDGTILCFYERGSIDGKNNFGTDRLTVARFNLEWLTDGADTTSPAAP
jgi:sialidase-1